MKYEKVKIGNMYETKRGTGIAKKKNKTLRPAVLIEIFYPVPCGAVWVAMRDIVSEVKE